MITESVKTILGADLSSQVEAALKGKGKDGKDVDLVVGNDGTFVPADKYNGANSGKTGAENALKAAAEALKAIGGSGDPAKIADDVKTAQATIETLRTDHQKEIARIRRTRPFEWPWQIRPMTRPTSFPFWTLTRSRSTTPGTENGPGRPSETLEGVEGVPVQDPGPAKNPDIKGAKPADPGARQDPAAKADGPVVI